MIWLIESFKESLAVCAWQLIDKKATKNIEKKSLTIRELVLRYVRYGAFI